jgi:hypothetical protein
MGGEPAAADCRHILLRLVSRCPLLPVASGLLLRVLVRALFVDGIVRMLRVSFEGLKRVGINFKLSGPTFKKICWWLS